jgi:hypothetical protein
VWALGNVDHPDTLVVCEGLAYRDCLGLVWERRRCPDIGRVELGTDSARNLLVDAASMAGCNRHRGALPVIWRSPG